MRIIVIGGGIGVLATAIALSKVGVDVEVYERAPELREVGAGIALSSNALRALDVLGMANDLQSVSVEGLQGTIRDSKGNVLTYISGGLSRQIDRMAILHRAELLSLLARHVDPARIHFGRTFVGLEQDGGGVTASFDTGETVRGDGLIAADGLRSAVGTRLFGQQAIRYAGYTGWRAVLNFPEIPKLAPSETWGRGCRFGIVPMSRGRIYWFATRNAPQGPARSCRTNQRGCGASLSEMASTDRGRDSSNSRRRDPAK